MLLRLFTALLLAAGALGASFVASRMLEPSPESALEKKFPSEKSEPETPVLPDLTTAKPASVTSEAEKTVDAETAQPPKQSTAFTTNDAAVDLIKQSEGLRLDAYSGGYTWLVGYGHTRTAKEGMRITEAQAEQLLRQDLADCETAVSKEVSAPLTENMFGALVSFCYNLGAGGMARSSIVSTLNTGDYAQAADNFLLYNKATIKGEKQVLPHLAERRERERSLFLAP